MSEASGAGLVLGVDGGGTKTLACITDLTGEVRGVGFGAASNFQMVGIEAARSALHSATEQALAGAGAAPRDLTQVCYGLAGADRPRDFEYCRTVLEPICPLATPKLVNDTQIALRAGTVDGVGLALVAGTGSNALGVNRDGKLHRVGGLDRVFGDFGGARDIAERAIGCAMRGHDGRGPETILHDKIVEHLGLAELVDLIEEGFHESLRPEGLPELGLLVPLVFEADRDGDAVARSILEEAGAEAALSANLILHALFQPAEDVPIVLGGSLYQRGRSDSMLGALESGLDPAYRATHLEMLSVEPVLGGVLYALDAALDGTARVEIRTHLTESWKRQA